MDSRLSSPGALRPLAVASLLVLAGCAGTGSSQDPVGDFFGRLFATPAVEVAPPSKPLPSSPAPARAAAAPAAEAPARKPAAKRPAPQPESQSAAVAAPAPADLAPPRLVGLTQTETVSLLGAPSAQFDRPPAKVWHYEGPDCALDVFFYLDLSRNEFSALRYTAAGPEGASTGPQCLIRIRDAQRK